MVIIKKKNNKNKYIIIIAIIILFMIATACLIVNIIIKNKNPEKDNNSTLQTTSSQAKTNETEEKDNEEIKSLSESNRMKRYIGNFFDDIEKGEYKNAYSVLNEEYKREYFPKIEEFQKYADKNFKNTMLGVTYDNIERWGNNKTGNMYVIWITVADATKGKIKTNFVIIEHDYNNYEMSFSVNIEE